MFGGDACDALEAQLVELEDAVRVHMRDINLVHQKAERFVRAPKCARDLLVLREDAGFAVYDEENRIGFFYGGFGLGLNRGGETSVGIRLKTRGVDE